MEMTVGLKINKGGIKMINELERLTKKYFSNFNLNGLSSLEFLGDSVTIIPENDDAFNLVGVAGYRYGSNTTPIGGLNTKEKAMVAVRRGIIGNVLATRFMENESLFVFHAMTSVNSTLKELEQSLGDLNNYDIRFGMNEGTLFRDLGNYLGDDQPSVGYEYRFTVWNK